MHNQTYVSLHEQEKENNIQVLKKSFQINCSYKLLFNELILLLQLHKIQ